MFVEQRSALSLRRSLRERGGIDGKTICMVGDLRRGRTVRSLSQLLTNYEDVRLVFAEAPADGAVDKALYLEATFNRTESGNLSSPYWNVITKTDVRELTDRRWTAE